MIVALFRAFSAVMAMAARRHGDFSSQPAATDGCTHGGVMVTFFLFSLSQQKTASQRFGSSRNSRNALAPPVKLSLCDRRVTVPSFGFSSGVFLAAYLSAATTSRPAGLCNSLRTPNTRRREHQQTDR